MGHFSLLMQLKKKKSTGGYFRKQGLCNAQKKNRDVRIILPGAARDRCQEIKISCLRGRTPEDTEEHTLPQKVHRHTHTFSSFPAGRPKGESTGILEQLTRPQREEGDSVTRMAKCLLPPPRCSLEVGDVPLPWTWGMCQRKTGGYSCSLSCSVSCCFLSHLYTSPGTRTHVSEIKSPALHPLSGQDAPELHFQ